MIGSTAWRALMRRNVLYRRRNWVSTILEVVLPICFLAILIAIKNAVENTDDFAAKKVEAKFPEHAVQPLTFRDYETALQAQRVCLLNETTHRLYVSGMPDQSWNWQIPMIACDSRNCREPGQDALDICEYALLAVSGDPTSPRSQDRARRFQQWVEAKYPAVGRLKLVKLFSSSSEMDDYVKDSRYGEVDQPKIAMGVVWEDDDPQMVSNEEFALQYKYRLRLNSTNMNSREAEWRPAVRTSPDTTKLFDSYAKNDFDTCVPEDGTGEQGPFQESCTGWYLYNGVLTFGRLVDDFILQESGATAAGYGVSEAGVQFVSFPTPAYEESGFYGEIGELAALLITLGLLYPVAMMIRYITREKEQGQKELLKTMSAKEFDIGASWFVSFFGLHIVTASITAMVASRLYENSDIIYLWVFWVLTMLSVVVFCMFVSTFTSKSVRAVMIGLLVFFAGIFLPFIVDFEDGDGGIINLLSLHPVAALSFGIRELGRLEDEGTGLKSSTVGDNDNKSGYTFNKSIQALIIDSLLWGCLTWYLVRVIPPDFGQALPWWFPISRSYWFPSTIRSSLTEDDVMEESALRSSIPFERVDETLERQSQNGENIEIHGLRKSFGKTIALDGLNMTIYKNHITALLGHNGAGKTTTINILTGALSPSGGFAKVAGKDIRSQMQQIRKDLGVCPQHNRLFPELTVREHVAFFARLKGVYHRKQYAEAEEEVDQALSDIALSEKRHTLAKHLSGGMCRKLSVACAFSGGNKVVLLDEPTSGMDPFSRRFTWNVIRKYRQDRCIILTTHFMDEADILGDRIGILSQGVLCCMGSPLFLKRAYGVGYQLTVKKARDPSKTKPISEMAVPEDDRVSEDDVEASTEDNVNIDEEIRRIVCSAVPRAQRLTNSTTAMSWQLPLGDAPQFAPMFDNLDEEVKAGTVSSWGISVTTIDEVFLAVARGAADRAGEKSEFASSRFHLGDVLANEESTEASMASRMNLEKEGLFLRHLGALFKKRAAVFRRDKKAWTCTTILPSIFVFIGFLSIYLYDLGRDLDPLVLSLDDYNVKISGANRNPIPFNNPGNHYTCQPGTCSYQTAEMNIVDQYSFCGDHARLQGNPACSISESSEIVNQITDAEAFPQGHDVLSVLNSSHYLAESPNQYSASRYGAIFYTHESQSVLSDSQLLYADQVVAQCLNESSDYWNSSNCNDFVGVGFVISYNYTALHAAPLYQVLADEALVREALAEPNFNIQCTIDPLPITKVESNYSLADESFYAWFLVVLSFPFIIGNFSVFVVAERESKAKHLQTVAGVEPASYWISTFLWDVLNYQLPLWTTVALMFIFDAEIYTTTERGVVGGVITLLILFGPAAASFCYALSFAFQSPSMSNLIIIISSFLLGMGGAITVTILHILGEGNNRNDVNQTLLDTAKIITWILRFFPPFCFAKGLYNTLYIEGYDFWEGKRITVWSEPVMLVEVIFLACEAVVYLLLAIYLDKWSSQTASIWQDVLDFVQLKWLHGRRNKEVRISATLLPEDEDVILEQDRVLEGHANDDLIVTSQLTKVYDTGKVAVNNLSLGIPPGECFGLLGVNGAGKTTTLAMLTAEFPPSSGDATIAGFSVSHQPEAIRRRVGYCPQFDAHFENLTGREHVELYASIKGVPNKMIKAAAAAKLAAVGLSAADADRLSAQYSGGMKRRLSLACALIGQPQIVFLDEATTGVDPVARREIWKVISDHVTGDKHLPESEKPSIVLTTHSMEECEALCPRLGIMANGRLRCLGSPQHLKNKFGKGYQIELKVKGVDQDDADFCEIGTSIQQALESIGDEEATPPSSFDAVVLNLDQVLSALRSLTGDESLAGLVNEGYPAGYLIWKDAVAPTGISLDELSAFAATELRMKKVDDRMKEWYPDCIVRERQETKVRYEIGIEGVQISTIFANMEGHKEDLLLADYGVSGTSLEHVFNTFAAEAEQLKQGGDER